MSFGRLCQGILLKCVPCFLILPRGHCFLASSLPFTSSSLKLHNDTWPRRRLHSKNILKWRLRPSKKKDVSCPDFYEKQSGRAVFFSLFIISYCMLSFDSTFPQGYVGPCVPCLQYFSLSSNKDADQRHLSIKRFSLYEAEEN